MTHSEQDIVYRHHGGRELWATLYRPAGEGPFGAVVNVHGGAWSSNDRQDDQQISKALAGAGVTVLAVDFRMPLRARSGTYSEFTDDSVVGVDASLAFIVLCYAVLGPVARYVMARSTGLAKLVERHHAYWQDEAEMAQGSPQHVLARGEAGSPPPALVIQGEIDENLTPTMAIRFADAYREAGGDVSLHMLADAPHSFIRDRPDSDAAKQAFALITDFVVAKTAKRP